MMYKEGLQLVLLDVLFAVVFSNISNGEYRYCIVLHFSNFQVVGRFHT